MSFDSTQATLAHIREVQYRLHTVVKGLLARGVIHDQTKLLPPEKEAFDRCIPRLTATSYGSEEYHAVLREMRPAIEHHNANNSHHPEFYGERGIAGMDLLDLVEMLCDWKAASLRYANKSSFLESLKISRDRFKIEPQLFAILENTVRRLGWEWDDKARYTIDDAAGEPADALGAGEQGRDG